MFSPNFQISFVIPHKGRESMLKQTLASIAAQRFDLSLIEVLVVTQNAILADETLPRSGVLKIEILYRAESETIAALRNVGVENSKGEFLAFLDADVLIAPDWVSSMMEELACNHRRVIVSAVQRCSKNAPPMEQIRTALSNAAIDTNVRFLPGRNLFLRRKTFEAVGGFPKHLVTCEDYFFTDKVYEQGELYYSSRSSYIHLGEDKNFHEMFKKEIWRGQSNLLSLRGRRIPLNELPSLLVPLWILFFALCTLIAALTQQITATISCFFLSLLPIALYTIRLHLIAGGAVHWLSIARFYSLYFPARAFGTLIGLFKTIQVKAF